MLEERGDRSTLVSNAESRFRGGLGGGSKKSATPLYLIAGMVVLAVIVVSWATTKDGGALGRASPTNANLSSGQAPDFTFTLLDGREVTFSSLRGKPVVLNFWASWCPPCREEAPTLEKVWKAYQEKGVKFLGVDIQDTKEGAQGFIQRFGITYPNGQDTTTRIATSYGITGIPETFFIARDGRIARHWIGPIEEARLRAFVEELLR